MKRVHLSTTLKKRVKMRTYIALGLLVVLLPIALLALFHPSNEKAAWFDDNYAYRTSLSFTHNANVSNTKVKFDIDTATLISAGKMQSDCGDSRFTDINGKDLLYYIDTAGGACNGASTDYYVLMPTIINGSNVIYHYYGNPSAPNGTQAAQFSQSTTTPSGGAASTGTEEKGVGPVGYWKFDEGTDNTCSGGTNDACDSTLFADNGAISNGASWKNEDLCVSGYCLFFDGSDDVLTVTNADPIDMDKVLSSGFSYEAWIKPNGAGEGTGGQVFFKGTNTWLRVDTLSAGKLDIEASVDLATTDATLNVASAIIDNQWNHIALTYTDDGDDEITIWVNGQAVGTSTNGVGSLSSDSNNLLIGGTTTNNFQGFIDEFKIYSYERTSAQMLADRNARGTVDGSSATFGKAPQKSLSDKLVGFWNLDEITANTCTGGSNDNCDKSGYVNDGAWTGNATNNAGKYGSGVTFDGTGDYISVADSTSLSPTTAVSIAAWVKPNSSIATKALVVKDSSYRMVTDASGFPLCQVHNGSSWQTAATSSSAITTGTWYHVSCTYDGSTASIYVNGVQKGTASVTSSINDSSNALRIGSDSGGTYGDYNGLQDEVRVYSRALLPGEVAALNDLAPGPAGWWKLDEMSGTSAYDSSTNSNTGTLSNSPEWSSGKVSGGLLFNKSNDSVTVSDNDTLDFGDKNDFSIGFWIKIPANVTANQMFIGKKSTNGTSIGYGIMFLDNDINRNRAILDIADSTNEFTLTTTGFLTPNTWNHIEFVVDEDSTTNTTVYFNGAPAKGDTTGTLTNVGTLVNGSSFQLSQATDFAGTLDDVRVYNYARTPTQVLQDMVSRSGSPSLDRGPVAYWKFDELSGSSAYDISSQTRYQDLTLTNSPTWNASGKLNGALTFNGSSQYASTPDSEGLSIKGSLTLAAWIKPSANTASTHYPIAGKWNNNNQDYLLEQFGDEIRMYVGSSSNYVTTNSVDLATGTWYQITAVYSSIYQTVTIYVNGLAKATTTTGTIPSSISDNPNKFVVGSDLSNNSVSYQISSDADDGVELAAINTWVSTAAAFGRDDTDSFGDINGGLRYPSVALANGVTINSANLYVMNASTSTGSVSSVHARIYADNVNSAAAWSSSSRPSQITNTTAFADWDPTEFAYGTWVTSPSITTVVKEIVDRAGWVSGNAMRFAIKNDGTTGTNTFAYRDYTTNSAISSKLVVDYSGAGSSNYFNGSIDDLRVYDSELSPSEALIVFNTGSINFGVGQDEAAQITDGAGNGPAVYLRADEGTGTLAADSSGNGVNGTGDGNAAWGLGKVGKAFDFKNSAGYVLTTAETSVNPTSTFTVSAWVYTRSCGESNNGNILSKVGAFDLFVCQGGAGNNNLGIWSYQDSSTANSTNGSLSLNKWQYVTVTYNGSGTYTFYINSIDVTSDSSAGEKTSATDKFIVGSSDPNDAFTFDGLIDEVKVYNYVRTQAQISYDYNRGAPLVYYKLDECSGPTAYNSAQDGSGAAYGANGTLSIGGSGTNTSVGSCAVSSASAAWYNGLSGKYNSSLNFDGTDDSVSIAAGGPDLLVDARGSYSMWVKPSDPTANRSFYVNSEGRDKTLYTTSSAFSASIWDGSTCRVRTGGTVDTNWHHIVYTWDSSAGDTFLYVDGRLVDSNDGSSWTTSISESGAGIGVSDSGLCGGATHSYWQGNIDEVQTYNYALSLSQVRKLFNQNSGARFGPLEGQP